jgi:hypothetical protein
MNAVVASLAEPERAFSLLNNEQRSHCEKKSVVNKKIFHPVRANLLEKPLMEKDAKKTSA